ncbi:Protein GLUTAMINE DUMPER 1 [Striga hermonthica]|uniref:Protein GLUTAMINE DUMPER 1 n=1 Tax=Striga hermonthica TaxID=68872 RepID=A0A9N7NES4_STRHE|nr:Protein GLUTAMINE DUMPER 1 [Striga hermonthica]
MSSKIESPAAAPSAAAAAGGTQWWNSPLMFIGGGLALMLGVIPIAICVIVAQAFTKTSEQSSSDGKSLEASRAFGFEMEPRVVVIMPGQINPTYIAKQVVRRSEDV